MAAVYLALLAGCDRGAPPERARLVDDYGLRSAPKYQPLVAKAIGLTNSVLSGSATSRRLTPGWAPAREVPASVPVHVVARKGLTKFDIAFVVDGCEAIFVQGPAFEAWLGEIQDPRSLSADPAAALAFLLLHEVGHVENRDCAGAFFNAPGRVYTLEADETKQHEMRADQFAADALRATTGHAWKNRNAAITIEMAVTTLSFLVSGNRIVAHPGASLMPTPDIFWDLGFSHPNLEWRLLSMSYALNPTPSARDLLRAFEEQRRGATDVIVDLRNSH